MIESFDIIVKGKPVLLILGSVPSRESLKSGMYYAHPQNRFWPLLFKYFDEEYSIETTARVSLLYKNKIALYDVIKSCERGESSLDSRITNEIPNDIGKILEKYPSVKTIILNGKKAEACYKKYFSSLSVKTLPLPSTSPANASFASERLFQIWKEALDEVFKI